MVAKLKIKIGKYQLLFHTPMNFQGLWSMKMSRNMPQNLLFCRNKKIQIDSLKKEGTKLPMNCYYYSTLNNICTFKKYIYKFK